MSKEPKRILYVRDWLNKDEGSAYIIINGRIGSYSETQDEWVDIDLEIKDCTRSVTLDFCYWTEEERAKRLLKVDRLISHLQSVRNLISETPVPPKKKKSKKEK